ncbi:hypothetical protein [Paraburkholderia flagellata]|uniref:hypothetical protein n=1 Tax=Paraburkholderia flagellata TaxID=2883241 RepID=UPI001F27BA6F|nr:hypothetical protein [Paraburkholderia flagellata]
MAAEDDTARADDAPRKNRWWKRLPPSVDYPSRRVRLLVVPSHVEAFTIREAADWLARVAADEDADPEQRQTLRGKYRFIYGHALCELIRSGDFHLVTPRTVSRETFERIARWFGYKLTCDPSESLPHASGVTVPEGRSQAFGLGKPSARTLYLPAVATAVELFAVPELLARAVCDDAPPALRFDTALLAETFERSLRDKLRNGRMVALAWDSREQMPGATAWAVLTKSAVLTREQFEQFAAHCGVTVSDFPSDDAQATPDQVGEAQRQPKTIRPAKDNVSEGHHLMKARSGVLDALIERSMREANGAWLVGWTAFVEYANAAEPEDPLVGYVANAKKPGVRYKDGADMKILTKDAYRKRVDPAAR